MELKNKSMSILSLSKKILGSKPQAKPTKKASQPKAKGTPVKAKPVAEVSAVTNIAATTSPVIFDVLVTEKSMVAQEQNTLVVRVAPHVTKGQIMAAIEAKYGVKALGVRTSNLFPKNRRRGTTTGRTKFWKKAYVTVSDIKNVVTGP